jgi:hypothetical protein
MKKSEAFGSVPAHSNKIHYCPCVSVESEIPRTFLDRAVLSTAIIDTWENKE